MSEFDYPLYFKQNRRMVYKIRSIEEHNKKLSNKLKLGRWQILLKHYKDDSFDTSEYSVIFGVVKYHSLPSEGEMMYFNEKLYK